MKLDLKDTGLYDGIDIYSLTVDENFKYPNSVDKFIEKFSNLEVKNNPYYFKISARKYIYYIDGIPYYCVGIIYRCNSCWWIVMNENEEFYILEYNQKLASSIDEFIKKINSTDFKIDFKMYRPTYEILKSMGWHKNRKVDISPIINAFKLKSIDIFPKAIEFYQEFYDISDYIDNEITIHIFNENDIISQITPERIAYQFNSSEFRRTHKGKKILPIGFWETYDDGCDIYITEDSEFYIWGGELLGYNLIEVYQTLIF